MTQINEIKRNKLPNFFYAFPMSTANLHSSPNLFMAVDEMRVKILPLLCRLGLVLRLGSVYVDLLAVTVWWR